MSTDFSYRFSCYLVLTFETCILHFPLRFSGGCTKVEDYNGAG